MTNEEAEKILFYHRSTGNLSPMLNEALDLAISALSKQCASTEQVGKDIKFPTIHCCRGYDCIKDENGITGFGVYDPKEKNIYIAGDVPKEIFLKALFHEVFHWVQDVVGMKFNEDDANSFSDILYDAVDMFDGRGPELFGQKTIVEPCEVFVGENVLKEALDHIAEPGKMVDQFRDSTKKTEDVPVIHVGKTDFKPGDKFILELGQERRMFGEFEIKGTDLYVKTSLLQKLKRYEPVANDGFVSKQAITDYLESLLDGGFEDIGDPWYYIGLIRGIRDNINRMKSEKIPYEKPEIICDPDCEGFVCHKNGIYGWCPKAERWGCDYFYELERRNDG